MAKETYLWVVEADACEACQDLEGYHDESPSFPHPNCACKLYHIEMSKTRFGRLSEEQQAQILDQSYVVDANQEMSRKDFDNLTPKQQRRKMSSGVKLVD